jgi:5-hydroxyisourate hydrolase
MSKITTHILDTTKGKPAEDVTIILYGGANDEWTELARRITNTDGRIADMLNKDDLLHYGIYKMRFETKDYFDKSQVKTFYPYVEIIFEIESGQHYHIPLLLNPFGYSTYRGS